MLSALRSGGLEPVGQITEASNVALLCELTGTDLAGSLSASRIRVIYKPIRGERPLWDFPDGTLGGREEAAWLVAEAGGWTLVPPTVVRDGPLGPGSVQLWIGDPFAADPDLTPVVRLVPSGAVPEGWLAAVDGQGPGGRAVTVVHEDAPDVRSAAVLDAVLNNSDRKGSHLVRDAAGSLWGFDHGVTFHPEPKLRTVLWGWAGLPLPDVDLERLHRLDGRLTDPTGATRAALAQVLPAGDVEALAGRVRQLLRRAVHPRPAPGWPSIPWPAL